MGAGTVRDRDDRQMLAWAACYWAGDVISLGAALQAFGGRPPLVALVAAYTTGYLVQSLPLPFVAAAGVDAATTLLLHAVGVPLEIALVAVVAHRVFAFWIPILPGCIFAFGLAREETLVRPPAPQPRRRSRCVRSFGARRVRVEIRA